IRLVVSSGAIFDDDFRVHTRIFVPKTRHDSWRRQGGEQPSAKDNAKIELRHSRHKRRLVCSASTGLCWSQSMKPSINRREFLKRSTVISAGLATLTSVPSSRAGADANNKIIVAVMGTNGRGMDHIQAYLGQPNVEIAYICDVDSRAVEKGLAAGVKKQEKQPKGIQDFREALGAKSDDVLS